MRRVVVVMINMADAVVQDEQDYIYWKEPAMLVKCLLNYFK